MTTQYTSRVTIVCPESLIEPANQLALIAGECLADVNTFNTATYKDVDGNAYSVCSTVVKPIFYTVQMGLPTELPEHAVDADLELAQQALDAFVISDIESAELLTDKLIAVVGDNALEALASLGLTLNITEALE